MLFFRKKNKSSAQKQRPRHGLKVDLHSHVIPAIDDGARNEEESIALLKGLEACGYQTIWTTPHIMSDYYRNTTESIAKGLAHVQSLVVEHGIHLRIKAAAEYYLDENFISRIKNSKPLAIADKYILFETSYIAKPLQMEEMIFAIAAEGYVPLLAHPERYRYITDPSKEYGRLKDLGVMFQVNLNSFGGHYGRTAKKLAYFLEEKGMIDFLGSDVHREKQTIELNRLIHDGVVERIARRNTIKNNELLDL